MLLKKIFSETVTLFALFAGGNTYCRDGRKATGKKLHLARHISDIRRVGELHQQLCLYKSTRCVVKISVSGVGSSRQ